MRLIVSDLDGTLLDPQHRLPEGFWPFYESLRVRGIVFAPATGRQLASVRRVFGARAEQMTLIAENGSVVARAGEYVHVSALPTDAVRHVIDTVRELQRAGENVGAILSAVETAYVERDDDEFLDATHEYYADTTRVADLREVSADIVKIAVYAFGDAATVLATPLQDAVGADARIVVSAARWVDVMHTQTNKGVAVVALQRHLGVTRGATAAFGDYLNDLEMLDEAEYSFAMADAHDDVKRQARTVIGSNREGAVVVAARELVGIDPSRPAPSSADAPVVVGG